MVVLFLSPGFPQEMNWFAEGLAAVGATVVGVGEHPPETLHPRCRAALTNYLRVPSLFDEDAVVREVAAAVKASGVRIDRVECLWEPLVVLAARLREALEVPGPTVRQTLPFRDKELMKRVLDEAGIRTPRHARCRTEAECREAAERTGFPLIVKPIAGAGSADTHRADDPAGLDAALRSVRHVPEVSVEEYIEGEEHTFDTVCANGEVLYWGICWYRPRPLIARTVQWISPQTVALRAPEAEHLRPGADMGRAVLKALGFETGFTHMEWFLKPDGEAVFGEIGARPPGARSVDLMNYSCDVDLFRGWAEACCHGRLGQPIERKHNASIVFKRAHGQGRIRRIEGLQSLLTRFGSHVACVDLLPVGAARRDWKQTLLSDGHVVVRHPDLATCLEMADAVGTDLQLHAG
jgi:biotin carboxylase